MARDINTRLAQLEARRKSLDRIARLNREAGERLVQKSLLTESWQRRAGSQPNTRYTLGAMQAVDADDTKLHIETAERVGRQLQDGLSIPVIFRLQGSVPLDVHIRRVSDVDLLTLDDRILTYDRNGVRAGLYGTTKLTSLGALQELRGASEQLLKAKYPAATVDCSGGKCIALSGGSLARPVDVVPSHWNDNVDYQRTLQEHDRGVTILNKKVPETILNLPFLHIKLVHDRDDTVLGGLKKAIRLTKNVKNDAEDEKSAEGLPSFDIAALLYHADQNALKAGHINELYILIEARRFLNWCCTNRAQSGALKTPDGIRIVLNSDAKWKALVTISNEMDELAKQVAREQRPSLAFGSDWNAINAVLSAARVPLAA